MPTPSFSTQARAAAAERGNKTEYNGLALMKITTWMCVCVCFGHYTELMKTCSHIFICSTLTEQISLCLQQHQVML